MAKTNDRRDAWLTILFVLLLMTGLALLALGAWVAWTQREYAVLGLGLLAVIVPASAYALAGAGAPDQPAESPQVREQLRLLESINERLLISDQAKRIAYRQRDRAALREAIIEDIRVEDYDAAMALVDEMTATHGYREEAEEFRQQIIDAQGKKREAAAQKAAARVDRICQRHEYGLALHEVNRFMRMYPDEPAIADLRGRVEASREKHKNELEREFLTAAERDDVERAMELMKELDRYLTPEEAAPYLETARGVVGKRRDNVGVRFKMAVQERDWIEAVNVGEQIIREFPNSQFAEEVRGMLDNLRERAAGQRAAMSEGGAV